MTGLITKEAFAKAEAHIENIVDHRFNNINLLVEALHAFPVIIDGRWYKDGNKVIAMVGDACIRMILVMDDYDVAGLSKGAMQDQVTEVACNKNLTTVGRAKGICAHVQLQQGNAKISDYMVATAVEAILGAVFLDSEKSLDAVRKGMMRFGLY